jgi:hypothetical protein
MRKERSFLPLTAPPTLIIVSMLAGCGASGNTTSNLEQIFPASAYSDAPVPVSLLGGPFHPPVRVDTYSGSADVATAPFQIVLDPLRPVTGRRSVAGINPMWKDEMEIDATLPAGLLAGNYTVSLRDAAGNTLSSSLIYTSLGPDLDRPHILFLQPQAGTTFAPGDLANVVVRVDDGAGHVRSVVWSRSAPSLSPSATGQPEVCVLDAVGVCRFQIRTDPGPDVVDLIDIRVDAEDAVHNQATADRHVQVASIPVIKTVDPMEGSTDGGTTITVSGDGLVKDLSQITVDGMSIGGFVDAQGGSITATTGSHLPGGAMIAVRNGAGVSGAQAFTFIPPPILKLIDPPSAVPSGTTVTVSVSGNNFRDKTEFFWVQNGVSHAIPYVPTENLSPIPPYQQLVSATRVTLVLLPYYLQIDQADAGADAATDGTDAAADAGMVMTVKVPIQGTISIRAHDPVSGDSTLADAFTFDAAP